eukprot:1183137-Prymnesium_polylepis.1
MTPRCEETKLLGFGQLRYVSRNGSDGIRPSKYLHSIRVKAAVGMEVPVMMPYVTRRRPRRACDMSRSMLRDCDADPKCDCIAGGREGCRGCACDQPTTALLKRLKLAA